MTNYQAIMKMHPKQMSGFLDQVYLTGLNTGMYAAKHNDDSVLDDNPFDMTWLAAEAEKATTLGSSDAGDGYMLRALTKAVFRSAGIKRYEKPQKITEIKVVEVEALPNHELLLQFNTGETRVFDFKPLLTYPAFSPLADHDLFESISLDMGVPVWMNGEIDIEPSYLYEWSIPEVYSS